MYQQGYRPDPFEKKRGPSAGVQAGYAPPSPHSPVQRQPRSQRSQPAAPVYQPSPVLLADSMPPPYAAENRPPHQQQRDQAPLPQRQPPPLPPRGAPRKTPPGKRGGPAKVLLAFVLAAGLCAGGYYFYVSSQVTPYDSAFVHGIYIDGIDMGGLSAQDGVARVQAHAQERQNAWNVRLMYRGQIYAIITSDMLGMEIKVQEILNEAWQLGHQGNVFEKRAAQQALREKPREFYTVVPSANTSVIDSMLEELKESVYKAPSDAKILGFDPSAENPFTYQQEVIGRVLDTQPLKERIYEMVSKMETGDIEIEPAEIQPSVYVADLMAQTALRATAVTVVSKNSTENRTNNIRVAFDKINGTVIKNDGKFSFNNVVGVRTEKNGFFEAIEYAYGTEVMGVGGGVCQASTTIYLAALKAGLEIVKREPHSDAVSYTEYGQDATVSSEKGHEIDFVFRNNTDGNIYISCDVQQDPKNKRQYLSRVRIYGQDLGAISYKVESKIVQTLPIPEEPVYVKDTKQEHVTYRDETKFIRNGKEGYVVDTYLITIQNNQEIGSKLINHDIYKAKAPRYWVGTKRR